MGGEMGMGRGGVAEGESRAGEAGVGRGAAQGLGQGRGQGKGRKGLW